MPETKLQDILKSNSHRKWQQEVWMDFVGQGKEQTAWVRLFFLWGFVKLSKGEKLHLPGLGTIYGKFRKPRTRSNPTALSDGAGNPVPAHAPATFQVKFDATKELRKALIKLAAEVKDPKTVFKSYGSSIQVDIREHVLDYIREFNRQDLLREKDGTKAAEEGGEMGGDGGGEYLDISVESDNPDAFDPEEGDEEDLPGEPT